MATQTRQRKVRGKAAPNYTEPEDDAEFQGSSEEISSKKAKTVVDASSPLDSLASRLANFQDMLKTDLDKVKAENEALKTKLKRSEILLIKSEVAKTARDLHDATIKMAIVWLDKHAPHSLVYPGQSAPLDVSVPIKRFMAGLEHVDTVRDIKNKLAHGQVAIVRILGTLFINGDNQDIEVHLQVNTTPRVVARNPAATLGQSAVELRVLTCSHSCIFCKTTDDVCVDEGDLCTDLVLFNNPQDKGHYTMSFNTMSSKLMMKLKSLVSGGDPVTKGSCPEVIALLTARFNRLDATAPALDKQPPKKVISFKFRGSAKFLALLRDDVSGALILPDFVHGSHATALESFVMKNGSMRVDWSQFREGAFGTGMYFASNALYSHRGYAKEFSVCPKCGHIVQFQQCRECPYPPETVRCKELLYVTVDTSQGHNIQRRQDKLVYREDDMFQNYRPNSPAELKHRPYNGHECMRFFVTGKDTRTTTGFVQTRISDDVMCVGIMYVEV